MQHDRRSVRKPAPDVAGAAAVTGNRRIVHVLPIIGILRRHDPAPISLAHVQHLRAINLSHPDPRRHRRMLDDERLAALTLDVHRIRRGGVRGWTPVLADRAPNSRMGACSKASGAMAGQSPSAMSLREELPSRPAAAPSTAAG